MTVTPDPRPRPAQVASGATQVLGETEFGATGGGGASENLTSIQCRGDVLELDTTRRVIYAELPCDRALSDEQSKTFLSQQVHVRVVPVSPAKLYLDSTKAGSAEFTVGRIWVQSGG